jgi:hypothetical protein
MVSDQTVSAGEGGHGELIGFRAKANGRIELIESD